MKNRRTQYEIYWEILIYCGTPRVFTAIINRCDLNSRIGQEYIEFLMKKGFLEKLQEGDRINYRSTDHAKEYIRLFSEMYQKLFDDIPAFRL